ncbi:hypothetical protein JKG47_03635 [Acidithiobacillus sp. MC6.1]|nr:hypothetical protein [Acidithiobacillus sp. MC6.1]
MLLQNSFTLPAIVRSTLTFRKDSRGSFFHDPDLEGRLKPVMMGVPVPACTGTGAQKVCAGSGATTLNREYNGNATAGTTSSVTPPQTCSAILSQWEATDTVPPGESCACPPGATQPQCVSSGNNLAECQAYLASTTSDPYSDCTCSSASPAPTCTSYYDLCEAALPGVQNNTDICSCSDPSTTPTPYCITKYQVCENGLYGVQSQNPTDVCTCTNPQTVTTPTCTPDIDICENQINSYQNSDDVCHCTQSSTKPVCVSKYSICEGYLSGYQTSNNVCTCSQSSSTPSCTSKYNICESKVGQYESGNTTCTCSQTSTAPYCCTSNTVQQCSTTQQCHQVCGGSGQYYCPMNTVCGSNGCAPYSGWMCQAVNSDYVHSNRGPFYCSGGPICWGSGPNGWASTPAISAQSCHNQCTSHTICTPVTHKTCTTE